MGGIGILKKGFTIYTTSNLEIKIPKNTIVRFHSSTPTISFDGFEVQLVNLNGKWYAIVYGAPYLMQFDYNNPPYPISYFK